MTKLKPDKLALWVFAAMLAAAGILRIVHFAQDREKVIVKIGEQEILAEVAKTSAKQIKGLAGRKSLDVNAGMFFVFKAPAKLTFWMNGMKFPLDFIWIRGDEIRDLSPNVPADYPGLLRPRKEVDKVLEVNAGFIEKHGVIVGDKVSIDEK